MHKKHSGHRPAVLPDSPLRSLVPDEPVGYVPANAGGLIVMFQHRPYGSLAIGSGWHC